MYILIHELFQVATLSAKHPANENGNRKVLHLNIMKLELLNYQQDTRLQQVVLNKGITFMTTNVKNVMNFITHDY
jgi:hypothetical protein